jgi:hypothetical protein
MFVTAACSRDVAKGWRASISADPAIDERITLRYGFGRVIVAPISTVSSSLLEFISSRAPAFSEQLRRRISTNAGARMKTLIVNATGARIIISIDIVFRTVVGAWLAAFRRLSLLIRIRPNTDASTFAQRNLRSRSDNWPAPGCTWRMRVK